MSPKILQPVIDWVHFFPKKTLNQIFRQDPTVFEGTIRFNIDPFDEFPDARLWEAVQSVQLMPYIRTLPDAGWAQVGSEKNRVIRIDIDII